MLLQFFTLLILVLPSCRSSYFVRIYSNQAEFIRPLDKLPLEFTEDEWNHIRSDSITLSSENINITSQTITEKKKSLNGAKILVRSPVSSNENTMMLVPGILVDESSNLVQITDESITGHPTLFFTVLPKHIFYLESPPTSKFYVNFTYVTTDSKVNVTFLQSNLKWHTQYQLNIYDDYRTLITMANIRNDGQSSVSIDHAELIGGDINLNVRNLHRTEHLSFARASVASSHFSADLPTIPPMIEEGEELTGLYVFPINQPFTIDAKTNYLLPMVRPHVIMERYGLISKYFSFAPSSGKAQRAYRLQSDRFISSGNCIVRDMDRIVGETRLPNLAAQNKFDFSLGIDPDIVYKENVTLISSTTFYDENIRAKHTHYESSTYRNSTRDTYEIHLIIQNYKSRSITVEYQQICSTFYRIIALTTVLDNNLFVRDDSTIKSTLSLNAYDIQSYSYTLVVVQ